MSDWNRLAAELLERAELGGFEAVLDPAFGSKDDGHRARVRGDLHSKIEKATKGSLPHGHESLTDLQRRPRIDGWALSISHCPGLGGYIVGASKNFVGFDLEESTRVTEKIVERVLPFELEKSWFSASQPGPAIEPALIWAAKEASIKAFGNLTRSDLNFTLVEITSFKSDGRFTSRHRHHHARGVATSWGAYTAAVAITHDE